MTDPIAAAIAAVVAPKPEQRTQVRIGLPSHRIVMLNVPTDLQAFELIDLIGYLTVQLPEELAKRGRSGPQLIVPASTIARG